MTSDIPPLRVFETTGPEARADLYLLLGPVSARPEDGSLATGMGLANGPEGRGWVMTFLVDQTRVRAS